MTPDTLTQEGARRLAGIIKRNHLSLYGVEPFVWAEPQDMKPTKANNHTRRIYVIRSDIEYDTLGVG